MEKQMRFTASITKTYLLFFKAVFLCLYGIRSFCLIYWWISFADFIISKRVTHFPIKSIKLQVQGRRMQYRRSQVQSLALPIKKATWKTSAGVRGRVARLFPCARGGPLEDVPGEGTDPPATPLTWWCHSEVTSSCGDIVRWGTHPLGGPFNRMVHFKWCFA